MSILDLWLGRKLILKACLVLLCWSPGMALKHRHSVEIVYIEAFALGRCTGYLGDTNLAWHGG